MRKQSSWTIALVALIVGRAGAQPAESGTCRLSHSLEDAWWTGPMLANSAATLPPGHVLVEPYLYDVTGTRRFDASGARHSVPRSNSFGSLTYAMYGLRDGVAIGLIPTAGFNTVSDGPSSSGIVLGDVTTHLQYRLTSFRPCHRMPAMSVAVQQTLPSGKYDRLGDRPNDGMGAGAYTTTLAFYAQTYFRMPTGRIFRMRFNVSQAFSSRVTVRDASVYGTQTGFRGQATPGSATVMDAAWEYSLTRSWVLALDAASRHQRNTRVAGYDILDSGGGPSAPGVLLNSGPSDAYALAPAIEYSWTSSMGVLLGARIITAGRNTTATITPAIAINIVH